jgi:hypothetical protein
MDYILLLTLIFLFLLKQYENVLEDKFNNVDNSFDQSINVKKIEKIKKVFNFIVILLILEIMVWVYSL